MDADLLLHLPQVYRRESAFIGGFFRFLCGGASDD
jgi:hypothetical protein